MDMAAGYIGVLREQAPQAEIIFDRFHVAQLASNAGRRRTTTHTSRKQEEFFFGKRRDQHRRSGRDRRGGFEQSLGPPEARAPRAISHHEDAVDEPRREEEV